MTRRVLARHRYRDTDVEGMSDGWDDDSAYGHTYELPLAAGAGGGSGALMSGGRPARWLRLVARNSGLFYLAATHECLRLMKILAARMAAEAVWDQVTMRPAMDPRCSSKVMMSAII